MDTDPLDQKLEAYARQPVPHAPYELSAGVWREIEHRRASSRFAWDSWLSPRLALTGLALAFLGGIGPALAFVKSRSSNRLASDSLHFDAFSIQTAEPLVSKLTSTSHRSDHRASP